MSISLPATLRLLSHELRTPVGVIQGYLKMLMDGRVEEHMRPKVIAQIQRAAARVAVIGQQASDLSHWVANSHTETHEVSVRQLVDAMSAKAPASLRLTQRISADCEDRAILTLDPAALVEAGSALIEAVGRSYANDAVVVVDRAGDISGFDLWVTATSSGKEGPLSEPERHHERKPIAFDESGLGLALLVAAAVADAHGGRVWRHTGHLSFGLTLPWSQQT